MLAIGLLMPQYLRERIDSTEMANELLEWETYLVQKPGRNAGISSIAERQELESLRHQMKDVLLGIGKNGKEEVRKS